MWVDGTFVLERLRKAATVGWHYEIRWYRLARRRNLLPFESYAASGVAWHVVLGTHNRQPLLTDPAIVGMVMTSLRFEEKRTGGQMLVYCLMPNHAHLVLTVGDANLLDVVRRVKSWTTNQWQKVSGESRLWQPSQYDHAVRLSERMDDLVAYVIENPVRKGLVADWSDWPWTGGILVCEER